LFLETPAEPRWQTACAAAGRDSWERRRHGRLWVAAPQPTLVKIDGRNAALVVNLSAGGMRVRALGRPVVPGSTVRLKFQPPGTDNVRAAGVVAWVNDLAEAGIEFVKLSQTQARRLREWCSENQIASAAQELMGVAGGWPAALELIAELARTVTGAGGASITLSGRGRACCSVEEKLPVRATLAAPIYEGEQVVGQLEVYAVDFGAFDEADLRALSMLAALLSEMVQRRAAPKPRVTPKPPLATRIADRMEGIWPRTVRVRVVLRIGNPSPAEMTKIRSATSSIGK